jgi:chromosome segregation ATPase
MALEDEKTLQLRKQIYDLKAEIKDAKLGSFGFMIKANESLTEGINRNYAEFDDARSQLEAEKECLKLSNKAFRGDYNLHLKQISKLYEQLNSANTAYQRIFDEKAARCEIIQELLSALQAALCLPVMILEAAEAPDRSELTQGQSGVIQTAEDTYNKYRNIGKEAPDGL